MRGFRKRPWGIHSQGPTGRDSGKLWAAAALKSISISLLAVVATASSGIAQSQSPPPAAPQTQATPTLQQAPVQAEQPKPQPKRVQTPTIADVARGDRAKVNASAPRVYTDDDVAALPPGGVSIAGTPPPQTAPKPQPKRVDDTAQKAAYWKARFTAARQKLAADKKALPVLQNQLDAERVQEYVGDPDTGQLYSDTHVDLLRQIEAMKINVQNDKKALSDLYDEFHRAGGLPGWIR